MKMMRNRGIVLLSGALFWGGLAGPAQASSLVFSANIPSLSSPWSQTLAIDRFNTALGVLTGVEIQATLGVTASIDFLNTLWSNGCPGAVYPTGGCVNPQAVHVPGGGQDVLAASASIPYTITGPSGSLSGTAVVSLPGPVIVPPRVAGIVWFCGTPTPHLSPVDEGGCIPVPGGASDGTLAVSGLTTTSTTPWTSVPLAGWAGSGAGLVNFTAATDNTDCFRNAHAGVFVGCEALAGGSFSVRYTFDAASVPEPVTAATIGVGLLGIALVSRRRRSL